MDGARQKPFAEPWRVPRVASGVVAPIIRSSPMCLVGVFAAVMLAAQATHASMALGSCVIPAIWAAFEGPAESRGSHAGHPISGYSAERVNGPRFVDAAPAPVAPVPLAAHAVWCLEEVVAGGMSGASDPLVVAVMAALGLPWLATKTPSRSWNDPPPLRAWRRRALLQIYRT